jgi:hypothetical protein
MTTPPVGAGLPAIAVVNLPHDRQIERWPGSLEVDKQAHRWQASSHRYPSQAGCRTMATLPVGAGLPAIAVVNLPHDRQIERWPGSRGG